MKTSGNLAPKSTDIQLFDFESPADARLWLPINDIVMGGHSQSEFVWTGPSVSTFQGLVSLDNGGGFASVRNSSVRLDLSGFKNFSLRIKGDGKVFKLRAKDDSFMDGVVFESPFQTHEGTWEVVDLFFTSFLPKLHGKFLKNHSPLDWSDIRSIGFLIANRQAGPFGLDIDWISVA